MKTVFYSWQLDRDKMTGRNLVHRALLDAIKMLASDEEANVEEAARDQAQVELDSDTQGVSGSPPIVETIFKKIEAASVFVADLTFVGERHRGRPTPNPNVCIEYGYALKALTHAKIVGVMNEAHGVPTRDSLPFDLGHMRFPITYNCPDGADETTRKQERASLASKLKFALKTVLTSEVVGVVEPARALFVSRYPKLEEARFRQEGEVLGVLHDGSLIPRTDAQSFTIAQGHSMWMRVMPKFAIKVDLFVMKIREALVNSGHTVTPLNALDAMNMLGLRGGDGYGFAAAEERSAATIFVYVLTSGEVWTIDAARMSYDPEKIFFNPNEYVRCLAAFGDLLARLGIEGPYRWVAGVEGMANRRVFIQERSYTFGPHVCVADRVICEGDYSGNAEDAATAIEPFIARVFDASNQYR